MAGRDLRLACRCGKITGRLVGASSRTGQRVVCHCKDCRAFAVHVGAADTLDDNGGTEIFQTLPARVIFTSGVEYLRLLRLSPKGLLRWNAGCCGTPMGNMMARPGFHFVGVPVAAFPEPDARDVMGPLRASVSAKQAPEGTSPPPDYGFARAGFNIMRRHLAAKIGIAPRGSPYFDADGPIAEPRILSLEERRAAENAAI